jgi:hypothetical protein
MFQFYLYIRILEPYINIPENQQELSSDTNGLNKYVEQDPTGGSYIFKLIY